MGGCLALGLAASLASIASPSAPDADAASIPPLATARAMQIIERRTIIRITPVRPAPSARKPEVRAKPFDKCIAISEIGRVAVAGATTLDLMTRSIGRIRVTLEEGCPAQHFYSGFYYARPDDGKLCVGRDLLHSRSGMKCTIAHMLRLEPR